MEMNTTPPIVDSAVATPYADTAQAGSIMEQTEGMPETLLASGPVLEIERQPDLIRLHMRQDVDLSKSMILWNSQKTDDLELKMDQEGLWNLSYELKNSQGEILDSSEQSFVQDLSAPTISWNVSNQELWIYDQQDLLWQATDANLGHTEVYVDDQLVASDGLIRLNRNNRKVLIRSWDAFGNMAEKELTIKPLPKVTSPWAQQPVVETREDHLSFVLDGDFSGVVLELSKEDGSTFTIPFESAHLKVTLPDGQTTQIKLIHAQTGEIASWKVTKLKAEGSPTGSSVPGTSDTKDKEDKKDKGEISETEKDSAANHPDPSETGSSKDEQSENTTNQDKTDESESDSDHEKDESKNPEAADKAEDAASGIPGNPSFLPSAPSGSDSMVAEGTTPSFGMGSPVLSLPAMNLALLVNGQIMKPSQTLYFDAIENLKPAIENGSLSQMTFQVQDPVTKENMTFDSLEEAQKKYPDSSVLAKLSAKDALGNEQSQSFKLVPKGNPIHSLSGSGMSTVASSFFMNDEGKLQVEAVSKPTVSALLLADGQPVVSKTVTSGQELQLYTSLPAGQLEIMVNGNPIDVEVKTDSLGQQYIPIKATGKKMDVLVMDQMTKEYIHHSTQKVHQPLEWTLPVTSVSGLFSALAFWLKGRYV